MPEVKYEGQIGDGSLFKKLFDMSKNDPVKKCNLYKNEGCAHVDGMLCDFPNCQMSKDYDSR